MPGLFGFAVIDTNRPLTRSFAEPTFAAMAQRLRHRPLDQIEQSMNLENGFVIGRVGARHINLAPWLAADSEGDGRNLQAFFAGVLHVEYSLTGKAFLRVYESVGQAALSELRGFYAVAVHSVTPQRTVIAVDRRSSVPLYYTECDSLLFFAPELKAFLSLPGFKREVDPGAVGVFLGSGHLLGEQTLFRSVRRLKGGEALQIEDGKLERIVYWQFKPGSNVSRESDEDLEEELARLVSRAVDRNLGDPDRTVIFLSGGGDSRGILAGALAAVGGKGELLNTVSWGSDQGSSDSDVAIADQIAKSMKLRHRFIQRSMEGYASNFMLTNYLVDGQSDIAAEHPHEYRIMESLYEAGFVRALRGDMVFGTGNPFPVYSLAGAMAEVGLRRLRGLERISQWIHSRVYREFCEASDAAIDDALRAVQELEPNDAKDSLRFTHRVQGYLNSAAYFKQIVLDHRNVLLDESLLDFMAVVPARLRLGKLLYRRAMARNHPQLFQFLTAERDNLEDWTQLLSEDTPIRRFVRQELEDDSTGIWEFLDRAALGRLLNSFGDVRTEVPPSKRGRPRLRSSLKKSLFSVAPALAAGIRTRGMSSRLLVNKVMIRFLVLKNWHDAFVTERITSPSEGSLS